MQKTKKSLDSLFTKQRTGKLRNSIYTVLFLCSDSDLLWLSDLVWFFLFWERIGLILLSFNVVRMVKHCKEKMVGCVCMLMTAAVFFSLCFVSLRIQCTNIN
jgi:hypothetical protein